MFGLGRRSLAVFALASALAPSEEVLAEEGGAEDKTLAPYFFVEGGDPAIDRLPLEATRVEVAISGVIADVQVTQIYQNDGGRPINARYVFPASTRAAVSGLRMALRDQVIEAQIQERKRAQKTFESAKREGKTASLLEQQRPNVFTMSLANVLAGDRVEVTLHYSELLVPSEGRYQFVFPTVVGPRYANASANAETDAFAATPYLHAGAPPPARVEIRGTVAAGLPIREIGSGTHALRGSFSPRGAYAFELDGDEAERAGNRDFVLGYRLTGDAIQSGLSLFDAGDEKFFLLLVEPPARVTPAEMPPRELVFIVDVSGSMSGFPLDTAKGLIRQLAATLRPIDKFNVVLFAGTSRVLASKSLPATPQNVWDALRCIDQEGGGGGTEMLDALKAALALSAEPGLSRSFLVITDGYVSADDATIGFVADHLNDANAFAFGIGSSVNRHLIEGLARAGQGEAFVVTREDDAAETATRFAEYVSAPVLTDVHVRADGFDAYALEPRAIPDVLAARPVVVVGKWRGAPTGALIVTGVSGRGAFAKRFDVAEAAQPMPENRALPILWARSRIAALSGHGLATAGDDARGEILGLGLKYSLLTQFTSFVAVSKLVRNTREPATDVKQPLPMPASVSDAAVGVGAEPELAWVALPFVGAFFARRAWRARRAAHERIASAA